MGNTVRQFERENIPQVAALFMRIFKQGKEPVTEDLLQAESIEGILPVRGISIGG